MTEIPSIPSADQRATLRAPLIIQQIKMAEKGKTFFGYSRNISRSGLFISTANPREPGSRFLIEIPLPAPISQTVQCTCEVVWQRQFSSKSPHEPGMGLRFIDMPDEIADAIDAWVNAQHP